MTSTNELEHNLKAATDELTRTQAALDALRQQLRELIEARVRIEAEIESLQNSEIELAATGEAGAEVLAKARDLRRQRRALIDRLDDVLAEMAVIEGAVPVAIDKAVTAEKSAQAAWQALGREVEQEHVAAARKAVGQHLMIAFLTAAKAGRARDFRGYVADALGTGTTAGIAPDPRVPRHRPQARGVSVRDRDGWATRQYSCENPKVAALWAAQQAEREAQARKQAEKAAEAAASERRERDEALARMDRGRAGQTIKSLY